MEGMDLNKTEKNGVGKECVVRGRKKSGHAVTEAGSQI